MKSLWLYLRPFAVSILCLFLTTCAETSQNVATSTAGNAEASDMASGDYRIAPNDQLQVNVFQVPDLSRLVPVNGAGFIALPLVGNIRVAGKTTDQAQQEIAARLGKSYLRNPQVSVVVAKSGQRITVNGAVRTPIVLTVDGRLTLTQAIAGAGGFNTDIANPKRVHVARTTGSNVQDMLFDHEDIQSGKAPDPQLFGGDIVIAEESTTKVAIKNVKDLLPFATIGSFMSDIRVKRDVTRVGRLANGLGLYRYRYVWGPTLYVGVIAQEVREVAPAAVTTGADGYLRVDYRQLGFMMLTWKEWVRSNPVAFQPITNSPFNQQQLVRR